MKHVEYQVPPVAHTAMYNWHKYWSRKTWNVVSEYVRTYCPERGIVIDPFSGSGVTAIEALRNNRRAIAIDINPIATSILRQTVIPVSEAVIIETFERISARLKNQIQSLYFTRCRKCKAEVPATCFVWKRGIVHREKISAVRYRCGQCGAVDQGDTAPTQFDSDRLDLIETLHNSNPVWYPKQSLEYGDTQPFKERQKYKSVDELFTSRALYAMGLIRTEIESITDADVKEMFLMAFSSMSHLCSKMMPDRPTRPMSGVWFEHSYWFAKMYMEQNVWEKFQSSVTGNQGILRAKAESNVIFRAKTIARDLNDFVRNERDLLIVTASSLDFMRELNSRALQCDYCFTDPPYDSSIQYGELSYMWLCWLKLDSGYLDRVTTDEVINNDRQGKNFDRYHSMLSASFKEIYFVLKPEGYLTVTFHNPTFKVRNATIRAAVFSGFDFQKIHHQELARPSAKSLLQPFGSASGDFYLRFQKPGSVAANRGVSKSLDEKRFRTIVIETTKKLLAERWEPTPYTVIINYIDPVLAKEGFFHELYPGLDVKTVLQNSLDDVFKLVPAHIGSVEGECWWFRDASIVKHHEIPLSERVERTVLRKLQKDYKVSYTDLWQHVNIEFPNSMMTDSTSIVETIKEYAEKTSTGEWVLKASFRERESEHNSIIADTAQLGTKLGFKVWIGTKEQSGVFRSAEGDKKLKSLITLERDNISGYDSRELKDIFNVDVMWARKNVITHVFEVENSTSITSALERSSHIQAEIERYILLPDERQALLQKKMHMPMFRERFDRDSWKIIYYENFKKFYSELRSGKKTLRDVAGLEAVTAIGKKRPSKGDQTLLSL